MFSNTQLINWSRFSFRKQQKKKKPKMEFVLYTQLPHALKVRCCLLQSAILACVTLLEITPSWEPSAIGMEMWKPFNSIMQILFTWFHSPDLTHYFCGLTKYWQNWHKCPVRRNRLPHIWTCLWKPMLKKDYNGLKSYLPTCAFVAVNKRYMYLPRSFGCIIFSFCF